MMRRLLSIMACWLSLSAAIPAFAQFTPISTPDAAYTSGTVAIPITAVNGTSLTSVTDGTMTMTLSTAMTAHTVPGGGWSTWNTPPATESATPRVLGVYTPLTTQTITLSQPTTTFGVEIEPDTFGAFSISVDFMNGATNLGTVTLSPNGSAGALLFAASSTTPITSVVITAPAGANGFALAQLRYRAAAPAAPTAVPTLTEWGMIILSILMAASSILVLRRRKQF